VILALLAGPALGAATEAGTHPGLEMSSVGLRIDSGAALLASGLGLGSGSLGDPYVIDGLVVDAMGGSEGLYIGNSSVHVVIRNCDLSNATGGDNPPESPGPG
jgi:hypothetical protein